MKLLIYSHHDNSIRCQASPRMVSSSVQTFEAEPAKQIRHHHHTPTSSFNTEHYMPEKSYSIAHTPAIRALDHSRLEGKPNSLTRIPLPMNFGIIEIQLNKHVFRQTQRFARRSKRSAPPTARKRRGIFAAKRGNRHSQATNARARTRNEPHPTFARQASLSSRSCTERRCRHCDQSPRWRSRWLWQNWPGKIIHIELSVDRINENYYYNRKKNWSKLCHWRHAMCIKPNKNLIIIRHKLVY